jgi:transcriptional regulator with XRE-family HTH domain
LQTQLFCIIANIGDVSTPTEAISEKKFGRKRISPAVVAFALTIGVMTFAEKLRALKGDRSHAEIARLFGGSPQGVQNWASGRSIPRADYGVRLAAALGVPAEWLFDDSQDWPPPPTEDQQIVAAVRAAVGDTANLTDYEREIISEARRLGAMARGELRGYLAGLSARDGLSDDEIRAAADKHLGTLPRKREA